MDLELLKRIDWSLFEQSIQFHSLAEYWPAVRAAAMSVVHRSEHGDLPRWLAALADLERAVRDGDTLSVREALMSFHPWRKGPVHVGSVQIDAEWRSDWKWERFQRAGCDLRGKLVLDVGCGNGYYLLRMLEAGARAVIGIDPMWLYVMQWLVLRSTRPPEPAVVLPLGLEALPETRHCFDVVFSWGILAHRRSPFDHLFDLQSRLRPGGTLALETLVLHDAPGRVLVPPDRYAQMRNVWFIPDVTELVRWLERVGYVDVRIVDVTPTTCEEQRATEWMKFLSLADALDPTRSDRTIEGHPAPVRAMILASVTT
ncbi:MAG: tRNA 5-methoxyuridine(34)/uridine 5-oxyacetic acid(34) synthase CmoB [Planctomycetota bacterium]|nr:tRNA 5-methoxyuridine(34)/uridine 5-oxyacetic acid(34) synthase CmoB [Planctomycetota bacterium]MDA1180120.1 tRNA 5-methoxyuridine(34)/uridine 5-oxyacetic acid(34) synthase CmoB [Planctomycetota bacterium]